MALLNTPVGQVRSSCHIKRAKYRVDTARDAIISISCQFALFERHFQPPPHSGTEQPSAPLTDDAIKSQFSAKYAMDDQLGDGNFAVVYVCPYSRFGTEITMIQQCHRADSGDPFAVKIIDKEKTKVVLISSVWSILIVFSRTRRSRR